MDRITLKGALPNVFRGQEERASDVWRTETVLERGGLYLVEAESGAGKSSLCAYLTGYRHDYDGDILFDGRSIGRLSKSQWVDIRQRHLSHLYQELRLFPELTALENVQIKNQLTGHKKEAEIKEWFERLGIADRMHSKVGRMSFGQQQRVALMRALSQPFDFLLADEPTSHLDDNNSAIMADIMMHEARRQGAAVIVTSIGKHMTLPYDRILRL